MMDIKEFGTSDVILGALAVIGMGVLAVKKLLNVIGFDLVKKNGNGTCKHHGEVCQALEAGEEKFRVIEQKLDDMPDRIITLLQKTKGLL